MGTRVCVADMVLERPKQTSPLPTTLSSEVSPGSIVQTQIETQTFL